MLKEYLYNEIKKYLKSIAKDTYVISILINFMNVMCTIILRISPMSVYSVIHLVILKIATTKRKSGIWLFGAAMMKNT